MVLLHYRLGVFGTLVSYLPWTDVRWTALTLVCLGMVQTSLVSALCLVLRGCDPLRLRLSLLRLNDVNRASVIDTGNVCQ